MLKTYIKTNLAKIFRKSSKYLISILILIIQKRNYNFYLFIIFQKFYNLIIKNYY